MGPTNRLPQKVPGNKKNDAGTTTHELPPSEGGANEQGTEIRDRFAPQIPGGRGRGDRRRCDAGLPDDRQGPGADRHALAVDLPAEGPLPPIPPPPRPQST